MTPASRDVASRDVASRDVASRYVDRQKDALLDEISGRLRQQTDCFQFLGLGLVGRDAVEDGG
jgi:hypothetical protein